MAACTRNAPESGRAAAGQNDAGDRLLQAQESGASDDVEKAALALERAIRLQAKSICEKYVHPPHSTDFAIMYLPTEGLLQR